VAGGQPAPKTLFSQKISNQNFEISILSKIVQSPKTCTSIAKRNPEAPGARAVSYASLPLLTYKAFMEGMVI
jgi:hypothetical protein